MRNGGRLITGLVMASIALAGCGGGTSTESGGAAGNLPPVIEGSPPTTLSAGNLYSFTPVAADPDGDPLTFSATNVPDWADFDSATGRLWGTPGEDDVGMTDVITIEVSDSKAVSELPGFRIDVASAGTTPPGENRAPTIAGTPGTTATVGQLYTFRPVGDDADDDTLTYQITNKPDWATFTASTGELRGTPASGDVGTTENIVIRVSDGSASDSLAPFDLEVSDVAPPANRAPTISGTPAATATVGQAYSFRPVGSDPDGNTLTYSIQNQPGWAQFSATSGRLWGTPTSANVGTSARITISVSDGTASDELPSFTIQVNEAANRAPTITGSPGLNVTAGVAYSFQPSASDPDGDTLTFSVTNLPDWADFNESTGRLFGTPGVADVGSTANIVISVSDGSAIDSLPAFTLSVLQAATGTATVNWTPPTTNTDGSALTDLAGFRVLYGRTSTNLDQSVEIDNEGLTSYTVGNLASGQWFFAVRAVNSQGFESDSSNVGSKTIP
jgi:hypothetical protein